MVSQNPQNFQNHSFSKESRQLAPFQRILTDAQKLLMSLNAPKGRAATASGYEPLLVRKKDSFVGFAGFVTKNNR
jgi:hypothetical protein